MKFFQLNPQLVGSLGDETVHDGWSDRPLKIHKFQLWLKKWPEDDLVEADMYGYAGSPRLADAIKNNQLTGIEFDHVDVIEEEQFYIHKNDHPGEAVPELLWFKFTGQIAVDDFGLLQGPRSYPLVVSERALELLKSFSLNKCNIKDVDQSLLVKP
jgi:hypothetical protein